MKQADHYDEGKSRVDLIPPEFIEALGHQYRVGAKKYSDHNWEQGAPWSKYYASAMRHMLEYQKGIDYDELGTPHLIAAAWNMAALHTFWLHGIGEDDRVKRALDRMYEPEDITTYNRLQFNPVIRFFLTIRSFWNSNVEAFSHANIWRRVFSSSSHRVPRRRTARREDRHSSDCS